MTAPLTPEERLLDERDLADIRNGLTSRAWIGAGVAPEIVRRLLATLEHVTAERDALLQRLERNRTRRGKR